MFNHSATTKRSNYEERRREDVMCFLVLDFLICLAGQLLQVLSEVAPGEVGSQDSLCAGPTEAGSVGTLEHQFTNVRCTPADAGSIETLKEDASYRQRRTDVVPILQRKQSRDHIGGKAQHRKQRQRVDRRPQHLTRGTGVDLARVFVHPGAAPRQPTTPLRAVVVPPQEKTPIFNVRIRAPLPLIRHSVRRGEGHALFMSAPRHLRRYEPKASPPPSLRAPYNHR